MHRVFVHVGQRGGNDGILGVITRKRDWFAQESDDRNCLNLSTSCIWTGFNLLVGAARDPRVLPQRNSVLWLLGA